MARKDKASVSILGTIGSISMIILALAMVVGVDMFTYDFGDYSKFTEAAYWTSFGFLTISVLLFFFAVSRMVSDKKESKDENYNLKIDGIEEVVRSTGLVDCDIFLQEYYVDKKLKYLEDKYHGKLDRLRTKADRIGVDLTDPSTENIEDKRRLFIFRKYKTIFLSLKKKYDETETRLNDPNLRQKAAAKKIRQVYRVRRALLSDGVERLSRGDEDRPINKKMYNLKSAGSKIAMSVAISFLLASMVIDNFEGAKFTDPVFQMYLATRGAVFALQLFNGIKHGLDFFKDTILGLAIIRENVLSKYLVWKNKHRVKPNVPLTPLVEEVKIKEGVEKTDETNPS